MMKPRTLHEINGRSETNEHHLQNNLPLKETVSSSWQHHLSSRRRTEWQVFDVYTFQDSATGTLITVTECGTKGKLNQSHSLKMVLI
jgi:hypothetical protein